MSDFDQWMEENRFSEQYLRLLRSGLKPEPGAWERSKLNMEIRAGLWFHTPEQVLEEECRLLTVRFGHRKAKLNMPKSRRRAANFRTEPRL